MGNAGYGPQPGFNYWLSFKGQGVYVNPTFNINGKQVTHSDSSHTTDLLTDYAFNYGVWDTNELYDLKADPGEVNNLIRSPQHQEIAKNMRDQVFDWLEGSGGMQIPLNRVRQKRFDHIYKGEY